MEWLTKDEQVARSLRGHCAVTARSLRGLIESGEWSGQLPGYRKLEQYLKVHRVVSVVSDQLFSLASLTC